jgi:hypothetical protein
MKSEYLMNKLKLLRLYQDAEISWSFVNGPLDILIGSGSSNNKGRFIPRNYWRVEDPNGRSLFSIDIEKESGRLLTMELTLYRNELYPYKKEADQEIKREIGIPVFDLSLWRREPTQKGLGFPADEPALVYLHKDPEGPILYNIPANFQLQIGDDELRIELFREKIMHHVTVGQKLVCEFNESDELCAVTLKGLDADSQAHIKEQYGKR